MGGEYADMELASFMSTSKGFMGEYVPVVFGFVISNTECRLMHMTENGQISDLII